MLSPIYLLALIFCICMQLPFYELCLSLPFKKNTSGKYITPHNSLYQIFWKLLSYELRYSLKHHLVIIECDHLYKRVLLTVEMVVWFILVVWIVWSWLCCWSFVYATVDLVVFVACEGNSSVVLNTRIRHTWQQIWYVTWIKTNPLEVFTPNWNPKSREMILFNFPLSLFLYFMKTIIFPYSRNEMK